jgi:hypothetical protein
MSGELVQKTLKNSFIKAPKLIRTPKIQFSFFTEFQNGGTSMTKQSKTAELSPKNTSRTPQNPSAETKKGGEISEVSRRAF